MAKKGKVGRKPAAKEKNARDTGGRIPLKRVCSDLGIEPKAARVKLRRALRREDSPLSSGLHSIGGRWDLTPAQVKIVKAELSA
jgi:hypothetical protein